MSKITFRADDDLVERVEEDGASKSEVMREALRSYLDTERESTESDTQSETESADGTTEEAGESLTELVDELVAERLRAFVGGRVDAHLDRVVARDDRLPRDDRRTTEKRRTQRDRRARRPPTRARETPSVVVNVSGESPDESVSYDERTEADRRVSDSHDERDRDRDNRTDGDHEVSAGHDDRRDDGRDCARCGADLSGDHVYCPNCGEKAARRVFCDCGDEVRSDWSFCPGCGRRTPAADVLDERANEGDPPRR